MWLGENFYAIFFLLGFCSGGWDGKEFVRSAEDLGSIPESGRAPWRMEWLPHGQKSLVGYSPWGCKESDTAERLTLCALSPPG